MRLFVLPVPPPPPHHHQQECTRVAANAQGKLPKRGLGRARGLAGYRMALTAPRVSAACSCSPFRCRRFFRRSFAPAALLLAELRRSANLKALEAPGGLFFWSCHLRATVGAEISTSQEETQPRSSKEENTARISAQIVSWDREISPGDLSKQ